MPYTIERVTEECNAIAKRFNRTINCPIALNNRLSTTLGRVMYETRGNKTKNIRIEFSKKFIENAPDEEIFSTIQHEMAHWLATEETSVIHHHDAYWKNCAKRIGMTNPTRCYDMETAEKLAEAGAIVSRKAKAKYHIYCSKCNKLVATRTRACNVTNNPTEYRSNCCKAGLIIKNA